MMVDKICAICGKEICSMVSMDHVYPRAIYKWSREYLSKEEFRNLKAIIESTGNLVQTHPDCNYLKEDDTPDLNTLPLSNSKHNSLLFVSKAIEPAVTSYSEHKQKLLSSQNGRCAGCGCTLQTGVLRRRNPDMPRRWENACIVCHECNLKNNRF